MRWVMLIYNNFNCAINLNRTYSKKFILKMEWIVFLNLLIKLIHNIKKLNKNVDTAKK